MSSSKAKKLKDQNVVVTLLKDINKRMADFESSVDELKILKESVVEIHDQIVKQEADNNNTLAKLKADLKENKTRILNETASEVGKVIISFDELKELKDHVSKIKAECLSYKASQAEDIKQKVEEQVNHKLKLQQLQHECEKAQLSAANDNFVKQVESLNESIRRMSSELDSQKKLTAEVARVGRPEQSSKKE